MPKMAVCRHTFVAETDAEAERIMREAYPAWYRHFVEPWRASRAVLGCFCLIWTQLSRQPTGFQAPVQHRMGGLGRNSSISRRISRNRFRGTATSANWNIT